MGNPLWENTGEFPELLDRYNAAVRQTMLLATHDSKVGNICTRMMTMEDGVMLEG